MITGPTGIFGENQDYKTIIREPFANDLAHMFDEWTVPLIYIMYEYSTAVGSNWNFNMCNVGLWPSEKWYHREQLKFYC